MGYKFNPFTGTFDEVIETSISTVASEAALTSTTDGGVNVVLATDQIYVYDSSSGIWHQQVPVAGSIASSSTANGISITSDAASPVSNWEVILHPADGSNGGIVTTGAQSFAGNKTFANNVIITGDLTVNGTTTTINTATLDVTDSNITVNNGGNQATADSNDAGITVEMSDATDAIIHYDSTATSLWKLGAVGATVEIADISSSQTLTNKSIDSDNNTITNIANADIKAGAAIDAAKIHDASVSNTEFGYLNGVTSAIQTQIDGKATTELDNLGTTAINAALVTGTGVALNLQTATRADATATSDINITSGNNSSTGNSGAVNISSGTSTSGTRGNVVIDAPTIQMDATTIDINATTIAFNSANITTTGSRVDFTSLLTTGDVLIGSSDNAQFDVSQDRLKLYDQWAVVFYDSGSSNFTEIKAPAALTGDTTLILPDGDATVSGQVLSSNASGTLSWVNQGVGAATKELDNLGTTAINAHLLPDTDATYNLGSSSVAWNNIFSDFTEFANLRIYDSVGGTQTGKWSSNTISAVGTNILTVKTENATSANSQNITFTSGTTTTSGNSGLVTISSGNAATNSGNINITTGTAGTTVGDINLDANNITFTADTKIDMTSGVLLDATGMAVTGFIDGNRMNLETDPYFKLGTGSWAVYDDSDLDGVTASPTNVTLAASGTSTQVAADPYDGALSVTVGSTSAAGDGVSKAYTINNVMQDQGFVTVKFYYGSSTGFATGDFEVQAYDVTNSKVLVPRGLVNQELVGISANKTGIATLKIPISTTTASMRLGFEVKSANTSIDLYVSGLYVGPDEYVDEAITEFFDFDSSTLKLWDVTGNQEFDSTYTVEASGYRVGDMLFITGYATAAGNSAISGTLGLKFTNFTPWTGYTDNDLLGHYYEIGNSQGDGFVLYDSGSGYVQFEDASLGSALTLEAFDLGGEMDFEFMVRINDWVGQSGVRSSNELRNETVKARYYLSASTSDASVEHNTSAPYHIIDYDTKVYDTHNAVTTGSSWKFTAPKNGYYKFTQTVDWDSITNLDRQILAYEIDTSGTASNIDDRGASTMMNGSVTKYLNKDQTYTPRIWQSDSASGARTLADDGFTYIEIEEIPDLSVYGVYGVDERQYVTSSTLSVSSGSATGAYLATGISVTLTPGVWELEGFASLTGATSGVYEHLFKFYEADGDNSTSQPTALGTASTYSVDMDITDNILETSNNNIFERFVGKCRADLDVTTTTTIYAVPRYNYSSASGTLTVSIRAKRIK